jgi:poly [ADP-ribose] polymerase 1
VQDNQWFHSSCFFESHQVESCDQLQNFEQIKIGDQIMILKLIGPSSMLEDLKFEPEIFSRTLPPLPPKTLSLMKLLSSVEMMSQAFDSEDVDITNKEHFDKLEKILKTIETAIKTEEKTAPALTKLSIEFFITSAILGGPKYELIDSLEKVQIKRETVNALLSIENSYAMMTESESFDMKCSEFYEPLKAYIWAIDKHSKGYELIDEFIKNTSVHGYKIKIIDVYQINRKGGKRRYEEHNNSENRMLLWHGTKLANMVSIIQQGLRIKRSRNGSMFGRGIYFADMASKSANYSKLQAGEVGLLTLSEVALGNMYEPTAPQNQLIELPEGYNSIKGIGRVQPDPTGFYTRKDGCVIPKGKPIGNNPTPLNLNYNEYVVYDPHRINMQYLVMFTT